MRSSRFSCILSLPMLFLATFVTAQEGGVTVPHVSRAVPVQTQHLQLQAQRPVVAPETNALPRPADPASPSNSWQLLATIPGAVIHDIVFTNLSTGYAAAEGGQVWKTTNGGKTWTEVLNLGYPYYFYGITAVSAQSIVVAGFYDSSTQEGLIRWSQDGGTTWSGDIVLSQYWAQHVRFANINDGLIMDLVGGASGNTAQYTTDGGAGATDWTTDIDNPSGGWFGLEFSLLPNLHARASGINFCKSPNAGATWSCGPSVDSVFDGPVFFLNDTLGWVGGGEISPNVEGWVHLTTNGGKTWSGRTLDGPWPIREILFVNSADGWAAGGNVYSGVGGIYFSSDGGQTWSVDVTTNAEMDACDKKPTKTGHRVWCAGYNLNGSFNGVVYSALTP